MNIKNVVNIMVCSWVILFKTRLIKYRLLDAFGANDMHDGSKTIEQGQDFATVKLAANVVQFSMALLTSKYLFGRGVTVKMFIIFLLFFVDLGFAILKA